MPPSSYVYRCASKNKQSVLGVGKERLGEVTQRKRSSRNTDTAFKTCWEHKETAIHHRNHLWSWTPPSSECPPCSPPLGKTQQLPAIEMQVLTNPHAAPALWHFSPGVTRAAVSLMHDCSAQWQHDAESIWGLKCQADAFHQARHPRKQRAVFSESISSRAEGLTGTHRSAFWGVSDNFSNVKWNHH